MTSRSKPLINEIYHAYNRGVEKRNIFMDDKDRLRFMHDLFEFNDIAPALNLAYHLSPNKNHKSKEVGLPNILKRETRKRLVDLLCFCLMPNHFHLMLKQKTENGISEFMRKLGTGYTNYFNQKYKRSGVLFQGKYKVVHLDKNNHFVYLPHYIHLNPLDLITPGQKFGIKDSKEIINFLQNYRWSSFPDYIGEKNFPSVTQREFLRQFFNGPEQYKKDILNWLNESGLKRKDIQNLTLEPNDA